MDYLYGRCSTNEERQNLLRQIKFGEAHGVKPENMFKEYISGSKDKRPELDRLLSIVKEGDTIYCSSIDRLTRSLKHFITLIDFAKEKKINTEIKRRVDENSKDNKLMIYNRIEAGFSNVLSITIGNCAYKGNYSDEDIEKLKSLRYINE